MRSLSLASANNGVGFTVLNTDGLPEVYTGAPATTLTFSLTNLTGTDVVLNATGNACTMNIFMPQCFVVADLQKMKISLTDWTFGIDTGQVCLTLTYSGGAATWGNGSKLQFDVTGVQTNAQPNTDSAQVNFINFGRDVPSQVTAPLSVSNPPVPGNGDLTKVLQISLDNQGGIIVSPTGDPLQNSLFLNIKNTGDAPLYSGTNPWRGNPFITVVFVYGSSSGSLASDNKNNIGVGSGSAWNIVASIPYQSPQYQWNYANPNPTSSYAHPKWLLTPASTNAGIIGTGNDANITFDFSNIISFTPPGHTQLIVQFTGFMMNDTTPYDDAVFVLDMVKQIAPPTRGLIYFFSPNPLFSVSQPNTPITVPLRWSMFDVASVIIITSYPGMQPVSRSYNNPLPLAYDSLDLNIPGVTQSAGIIITIQSYSGTGGFLNSMQFTVFVQANMFVDPRDGKVYPVVKVNQRLWMAANLDYIAPSGSTVYGPEAQNGRLYTYTAAAPTNIPGGWRLPNKDDWMNLLQTYTYTQLVAGGSSGFNAQLNGWMDNQQNESNFNVYGYYWSGINDGGSVEYVSFSSRSGTANYIGSPNGLPVDYSLSVRYVKDIS